MSWPWVGALARVMRHARFYLAALLAIVVVTYVIVPWVVGVIDAVRGYDPAAYYEPKDFTRQEWIRQHGIRLRDVAPGTLIVEIVLVVLLVVVWVMVFSRGGARRR